MTCIDGKKLALERPERRRAASDRSGTAQRAQKLARWYQQHEALKALVSAGYDRPCAAGPEREAERLAKFVVAKHVNSYVGAPEVAIAALQLCHALGPRFSKAFNAELGKAMAALPGLQDLPRLLTAKAYEPFRNRLRAEDIALTPDNCFQWYLAYEQLGMLIEREKAFRAIRYGKTDDTATPLEHFGYQAVRSTLDGFQAMADDPWRGAAILGGVGLAAALAPELLPVILLRITQYEAARGAFFAADAFLESSPEAQKDSARKAGGSLAFVVQSVVATRVTEPLRDADRAVLIEQLVQMVGEFLSQTNTGSIFSDAASVARQLEVDAFWNDEPEAAPEPPAATPAKAPEPPAAAPSEAHGKASKDKSSRVRAAGPSNRRPSRR